VARVWSDERLRTNISGVGGAQYEPGPTWRVCPGSPGRPISAPYLGWIWGAGQTGRLRVV
jgi:hypothetical protein